MSSVNQKVTLMAVTSNHGVYPLSLTRYRAVVLLLLLTSRGTWPGFPFDFASLSFGGTL